MKAAVLIKGDGDAGQQVVSSVPAPACHPLLPVLVFGLAALGALLPMLLAETLGGDFYGYSFPYWSMIRRSIMSGELPLWNPYVLSGTSVSGNIQSGLLYPPSWLSLLLPVGAQLKALISVHMFLIGFCTYAFLRRLEVSWQGSLVGGLVFMLSGAVVARATDGHIQIIETLAWLPVTLYLLDRLISKPSRRMTFWLALALAMQILAGYVGTIYYSTVLVYAPYVLTKLYMERRTLSASRLMKIGGAMLFSSIVALLIVSPLLLPSLETSALSTRQGGLSYQVSSGLGLPFSNLITLLFPWFWGGAGGYHTYWGEVFPNITQIYVGILPLVGLMGFAIVSRQRWIRNLFATLAASGLLLALSDPLPFYRIFFSLVPGAQLFRFPHRFLFVFAFAAAVLAAIGYDELIIRLQGFRLPKAGLWRKMPLTLLILPLIATAGGFLAREALLALLSGRFPHFANVAPKAEDFYAFGLIGLLVGLLFYLVLTGRLVLGSFKWLAIVVVAVDLIAYDVVVAQNGVIQRNHSSDPVVEFLKKDGGLFRVHSINSQITGSDPFGYENRGMVHGIQSIDGYDPVVMKRYEEYANAASGRPIALPDGTGVSVDFVFKNTGLFDLLNVKYVLSYEPIGDRSLDPIPAERIYGRSGRDGDVHVYVNREMAPRFALFDRYESLAGPTAVLGRLSEKASSSLEVLLLEQPLAGGDEPVRRRPNEVDTVEILSYKANEIRLKTRTDGRRLLFASEMFYPGWKAFVDGVEKNVYQADYLFRAVAVDGGEHEVTFSFQPESLRRGLTLAVAGAAMLLGLVLWLAMDSLRSRRDIQQDAR